MSSKVCARHSLTWSELGFGGQIRSLSPGGAGLRKAHSVAACRCYSNLVHILSPNCASSTVHRGVFLGQAPACQRQLGSRRLLTGLWALQAHPRMTRIQQVLRLAMGDEGRDGTKNLETYVRMLAPQSPWAKA